MLRRPDFICDREPQQHLVIIAGEPTSPRCESPMDPWTPDALSQTVSFAACEPEEPFDLCGRDVADRL